MYLGQSVSPVLAVSCGVVVQVKRTYSQGTYRAGAMRQVSLVGAVDEEVGDYFPEFISMLADSPFLEVCAFFCRCCCSSSSLFLCLWTGECRDRKMGLKEKGIYM